MKEYVFKIVAENGICRVELPEITLNNEYEVPDVMAKIVITIQDEMPVNGLNDVTISYDGDLDLQGELTMAQIMAYNIKELIDVVEFETKRLSKAN